MRSRYKLEDEINTLRARERNLLYLIGHYTRGERSLAYQDCLDIRDLYPEGSGAWKILDSFAGLM